MEEWEAHLGVRLRTGDLQPEVAPSEEQWFHPEQVHLEDPSDEQCHPGVATSEQAHRLKNS